MGLILPANKLKFWDAFNLIGQDVYCTSWSGNEAKVHNIIKPMIKKYLIELIEPLYERVYYCSSQEFKLVVSELDKFITKRMETFPDDRAKEKEFWIGDCTLEDCIRYMSVYKSLSGKSSVLKGSIIQDITAFEIKIPEAAWIKDIVAINQDSTGYINLVIGKSKIDGDEIAKLEQFTGLITVSRDGVHNCLQSFKQSKLEAQANCISNQDGASLREVETNNRLTKVLLEAIRKLYHQNTGKNITADSVWNQLVRISKEEASFFEIEGTIADGVIKWKTLHGGTSELTSNEFRKKVSSLKSRLGIAKTR